MKTEPILIDVPAVIPDEILKGKHALDCFVVFTWYAKDERWKMWDNEHALHAGAVQWINMYLPKGHTHAAIFHLTTK